MVTSVLKLRKGGQVAFGLEWSTLPGISKQRAEVKDLVKQYAAKRVALYDCPTGGSIVGLLKTKKRVKGRAFAAAALFSKYVGDETAMYCHDLGNGFYGFVGSVGGMPLPGFDVVGTPDQVYNVASRFKDLHRGNSIPLYGDVGIVGQDPTPVSPEDMVGRNKRQLKGALLRATKIPAEYFLIGLVLAVCAVAGPKMYAKWQADRAAERARLEQETQQKLDPNAWYANTVAPILATAGFSAAKVTEHLLKHVDVLPLYHAGWKLESAKCNFKSCLVALSMEPGSSLGEIKGNPFPGIQNVTFDVKARTLSGSLEVSAPSKDLEGVKEGDLPKVSEFEFDQDDNNIKNEKVFKAIVREAYANVVTMPPTIAQAEIRQPIVMGAWRYDGDINGIDVIRTLPSNMTLESMTVNFSTTPFGLSAEGKYYAKN